MAAVDGAAVFPALSSPAASFSFGFESSVPVLQYREDASRVHVWKHVSGNDSVRCAGYMYTQHLDWQATADNLRPDGVLKRVYLINGASSYPSVYSLREASGILVVDSIG